ncbi:hypothetical protein E4H12_06320 [Candidatus Thorarchaeota archaeon]|nr:MAG: hypothetical protein E4H12_06320 [Candidatus Thorarchaeota archaeon]
MKRQARRLASDIAEQGDPITAKFWAKQLSKQYAQGLAEIYKMGYDEVHKDLVKKIIKYLGEDMDIKTVLEQQQYELYVDLDGVLVDFAELVARLVPGLVDGSKTPENKKLDRKMWQTVSWLAKRGEPFWGQMNPMPDAMTLWNYIKKYNPQILSATGMVGNPVPEKKAWVQKHLGNIKVNLVKRAVEKAQYAAPNRILIDDKMKAITPWREAGGIGIHHTSAANTIDQLKELGL